MKRRLDGKIFAVKTVKEMQENDLDMVRNEASLNAYLHCDELIKCIEMYHYRQNISIVLEYMDQGSMT